jgi:hypothetical protein
MVSQFPIIFILHSSKQKDRANMKAYPILLLLLLSLFVDDALAAKKGVLFVDDALLATKKGNADHHANKSTPVNFSTQQSPRVYKSAQQFRDAVSCSGR